MKVATKMTTKKLKFICNGNFSLETKDFKKQTSHLFCNHFCKIF